MRVPRGACPVGGPAPGDRGDPGGGGCQGRWSGTDSSVGKCRGGSTGGRAGGSARGAHSGGLRAPQWGRSSAAPGGRGAGGDRPSGLPGPAGRARPAAGQARPGGRRRRGAQPAVFRPARDREVHAGQPPAGHTAGTLRGRGPGDGGGALGERARSLRPDALARAALSLPSPHRLGGGTGRGREQSAAGGDLARPPRGAFP